MYTLRGDNSSSKGRYYNNTKLLKSQYLGIENNDKRKGLTYFALYANILNEK